jgi:hypothetical protein
MTVIISKVGFTFRDARGHVGRVGWYYRYNSGSTSEGDALATAQALGPLVRACSNAALIGGYGLGAEVFNPQQYGAASNYQNVEDKATITMLDVAFGLNKFSIPAPKSTIFLADQETVNQADASVTALLAALSVADTSGGYVSDRYGNALTFYVAGVRRRLRFHRKITIWTRIPAETGPDE